MVSEISTLPNITDLSCTTNGFLLPSMAEDLARSGLQRVNISLDTLRPDRFTSLARRGTLTEVLEGLQAAKNAGLDPIKLNCVAMRGYNDDEATDFARLTLNEDVHVRFIELMPMRWNLDETPGEFDSFSVHGGKGLLQLKQASGAMLSDAEMRRLFVPASELRASNSKPNLTRWKWQLSKQTVPLGLTASPARKEQSVSSARSPSISAIAATGCG